MNNSNYQASNPQVAKALALTKLAKIGKFPRSSHRNKMSGGALLWMLLWVLGIAAILFFCVQYHWPSIQPKLQSKVDGAVAGVSAASAAPVQATLSDGRDVTLTGNVASQEDLEQVIASVEETPGVRRVFNSLAVVTPAAVAVPETAPEKAPEKEPEAIPEKAPEKAPEPAAAPELTPASLHMVNTGDGIVLTGLVPSEADSEFIMSGAASTYAGIEIDNQIEIDENTESPNWLEPAVKSMDGLAGLKNAELHIENSEIEIGGQANNNSDAELAKSAIQENFGQEQTITSSIIVSPLPDPIDPQLSIVNNEGDISVSGALRTEAEKNRVLDRVRTLTGKDQIQDEVTINPTVRVALWLQPLLDTLDSATGTENLNVDIADTAMTLSAEAPDVETKDRIENTMTTDLGKLMSVESTITVAEAEPEPEPEPEPAPEPEPEPQPEPDPLPPISEPMAEIDTRAILFDSGSDNLKPESRKILDEIAQVLERYPDTIVTIAGYTDSSGDNTQNLLLSQNRADAVRDYLTGKNIAPEVLRAYGYGELAPIADNATPEGRAQNRRIEFNF